MDSFVETAEYLNNYVSPYCLSATLVFAAELDGVTAYLFTASFLAWLALVNMYIQAMMYKHGVVEFVVRNVRDYARHVVEQLKELQHFYLVKVLVGVLLAYFVASCALWLWHVDLVNLVQSTMEFLVRLPALLFDRDGLIMLIQEWLHRVFLSHVVAAIATLWRWQKELIAASLLWGSLSVCGMFVFITLLLEVAVWLHGRRWVAWVPARVVSAWDTLRAQNSMSQTVVFMTVSAGVVWCCCAACILVGDIAANVTLFRG